MEYHPLKMVVVSETAPLVPIKWEPYFIWLKTPSGKFYTWNGNDWIEIADTVIESELEAAIATLSSIYAAINHTHPTLNDINFTGTVSADGSPGLTGQRTIQGYTLTFKKGLLVGFQAP